MEAIVFSMPTPTALPTVTPKAQFKSTSLSKRAAEPTTLDVPPQATHPQGEGSQVDVHAQFFAIARNNFKNVLRTRSSAI